MDQEVLGVTADIKILRVHYSFGPTGAQLLTHGHGDLNPSIHHLPVGHGLVNEFDILPSCCKISVYLWNET